MMYFVSKTILTIYRYLESTTKDIDMLVEKCATNTKFSSLFPTAKMQIEQVTKLMDKKSHLVNLRNIVKEGIATLSSTSQEVLNEYILKRFDPMVFAEKRGMSERTAYRHLSRAVTAFAGYLTKNGFNKEWFFKNYFNQRWIEQQYASQLAQVK